MSEDHKHKTLTDLISYLMEQDAPPSAPFGQYLFGPAQKSPKARQEPDTGIEKEFEKLLSKHYAGGHYFPKSQSKRLADILLNVVKPEIRKGNYAKYLAPPNTPVYRGIVMSQEEFLKTVNLDKNEFDSPETFGKGWYVAHAGVLNTAVRDTMSWTTDYKVAAGFAGGALRDGGKKVGVLFVANTGDRRNNFFVNPNNTLKAFNNDYFDGTQAPWAEYTNEKEVISAGPVYFTELSFHAPVSEKIEAQVVKQANSIAYIAAGKYIMGPDFAKKVEDALVKDIGAIRKDKYPTQNSEDLNDFLVRYFDKVIGPTVAKQLSVKIPRGEVEGPEFSDVVERNTDAIEKMAKLPNPDIQKMAKKLVYDYTKRLQAYAKGNRLIHYVDVREQTPEESLPHALGLQKKAPSLYEALLDKDNDV